MNTRRRAGVGRRLASGTLLGASAALALTLLPGPPPVAGTQAAPVHPVRERLTRVWGQKADYVDPLGRFAVLHGKIFWAKGWERRAACPERAAPHGRKVSWRRMGEQIPPGRVGQPDGIARVVVYRASTSSGRLTGETIPASDGFR